MLALDALDVSRALADCREALGTRTTSSWHAIAREVELERPHWLRSDDGLARVFDHQERLFVRGRVVLGALVQANQLLFQHGDVGAPLEVVYSEDPWFEENPDELHRIAARAFELKAETPEDPELAPLAAHLADEHGRAHRMRVPDVLTGGRVVHLGTTYASRRTLPNGWIQHALLPVLVAPDSTPACMLLPAKLWPREWLARWADPAPNDCTHAKEREVAGRGWLVPVLIFACDLGVKAVIDAATGVEGYAKIHTIATTSHNAVAGVVLLAIAPWLKRTSRKRYRLLDCAHRVDVVRDDRFVFLTPFWWGVVLVGLFVAAVAVELFGG